MERASPVLFTQTGCNDSRNVRDWLNDNGVSFTERNVSGDEAAARDLFATGCFCTPLLVVGSTTVLGFRPAALAAALGLTESRG